jgi:sugar lactone lactonase YvrE
MVAETQLSRSRAFVAYLLASALVAACSGTASPGPSAGASPAASSTPSATATPLATPTPCTEPTATVGCLSTIAGGGTGLQVGVSATSSELCETTDVAADAAGNLYIANAGLFFPGPACDRILKVDTQGILTVFAGTGEKGFSGDGGPATAAQLNIPVWMAADREGNVYFADTFNYRVRKVDTKGIISTFAGTGEAGFTGDGGPATAAQLFAGGSSNWCDHPGGMAFDADGNLFLADEGAVRMIDRAGKISTVAGTGTFGHSGDGGPATQAGICASDVALDNAGNLYISGGGEVIRRVDADGVISNFAGGLTYTKIADGGPAATTKLLKPWGIAVDSKGQLYLSEHRANRIRRIGLDGVITTVAGVLNPSSGGQGLFNGDGLATEVQLNESVSVFVDANDVLYIADTFNGRIRAVHFAP